MSNLYQATIEHQVLAGTYRSSKVFDHRRLAYCLSREINGPDPAHGASSPVDPASIV
jgi:hypothetical protein